MLAVVDSGPLYASVNRSDADHAVCAEVLSRPDLTLVIPSLVIAEVCHFIGTRMGPRTEATFLRELSTLEIEWPRATDLVRMAELVTRYADFPLGGTDAFVIAVAERLKTDLVITLDRRHFAAVKPRHCKRLRLLPEEH